jgi:glyoxylase-like metal-dependent hydrolase (beta-lactamase superfamily II)
MSYTIRAFNAGTFWVPGPEVFWMHGWGTREEMNVLMFLVQGRGRNILINTGPPRDLTVLNAAWLDFFKYPEAQISRTDDQLPESILRSQGLTPDDISTVIVTPLQAYATANIHLFRKAEICISRKGWIEVSGAVLSPARSASPAGSSRGESLSAERGMGSAASAGG